MPYELPYEYHKLQTYERPKGVFEYYVTGNGTFPFDMLRHDSAWPATSADADKIGQHSEGYRNRDRVSIKLRSYREPTVARWASFTWSVGCRAVVEG